MKYTGERVIPKLMNHRNGMLVEHIARYKFAADFCKGRVLDIACGVGYGSEIILSKNNNNKICELLGIDICMDSIDYAKEHYNFSNTFYYKGNALDTCLHDKYDTFEKCYLMVAVCKK